MPPAHAYALEPDVDLLAAYAANCKRLGLTGVNLPRAAAAFVRRWPDPQQWAAETDASAPGGLGRQARLRDVLDAHRTHAARL